MEYKSVEAIIIEYFDDEYKLPCLDIITNFYCTIKRARGSTNNHQAWPGGFYDHTQETMNYAILLYSSMQVVRSLPFKLSDALFVLFAHDLEKPWKYIKDSHGEYDHNPDMQTKEEHHEFRMSKLFDAGIVPPHEIERAIFYTEGELDNYTNRRRVMSPLAAFTHMCDICSARIYFDNPDPANDPWTGAKRS